MITVRERDWAIHSVSVRLSVGINLSPPPTTRSQTWGSREREIRTRFTCERNVEQETQVKGRASGRQEREKERYKEGGERWRRNCLSAALMHGAATDVCLNGTMHGCRYTPTRTQTPKQQDAGILLSHFIRRFQGMRGRRWSILWRPSILACHLRPQAPLRPLEQFRHLTTLVFNFIFLLFWNSSVTRVRNKISEFKKAEWGHDITLYYLIFVARI